MSDFLARMEASGLGTWVRESPSLWAYPTILALHSIGLGIVVGAAVIIDLKLLGRAPAIRMADLRGLLPVVWWAFAVNALTGALLFIADATRKSAQPVFFVKLACIVLALFVLLRARSMMADPGAVRGDTTHKGLAFASLTLWLGAIAAGRLMAYL
jgi:hypothetical protein